jgi:hypothetical protein
VSQGRSDFDSAEVSWEGKIMGEYLAAQVGYEHQSPRSAGNARGAFGFIQWRKPL